MGMDAISSSTNRKSGTLSPQSAMIYGPRRNPTAPPKFPPRYATLVAVARMCGGNQRAESREGDDMTIGPTAALMI